MEKLSTSFGAQYGVKFLGETKFDFWRNGRQLFSLKRAQAKRELEFIQGHPMTVFSEISEFLYLEEGQEFLYDGSSCVKFLAKIQTHLSQLDDKYRPVIASVQRKLKIKSVSQEKDYNALLGYCLRCSKSPIQFTVMTLLYGTLQDTYSSGNLCPLMYCAPVISRKTIDCISA